MSVGSSLLSRNRPSLANTNLRQQLRRAMHKPQEPEKSPYDSLAAMPPTPVEKDRLPRAANIGLGAITLTIAGAGAIVLVAGAMTPAIGAMRSTKLEWERRQLLMEQAEREAQAQSPIDAPSAGSYDVQPNANHP